MILTFLLVAAIILVALILGLAVHPWFFLLLILALAVAVVR